MQKIAVYILLPTGVKHESGIHTDCCSLSCSIIFSFNLAIVLVVASAKFSGNSIRVVRLACDTAHRNRAYKMYFILSSKN